MTTYETADQPTDRGTSDPSSGCPIANFTDVNRGATEALWHFDNWDKLREDAPMYFGDANGHEFWTLTRMADIRKTFQDPHLFSNSAVVPSDPEPPYMWIPEMLDPPVHTKWRQLLGPHFSPAAVASLEPRVRELMDELMDEIAPLGKCDFVQDVALRYPNVIFMEIMGLPVEDAALFQEWETDILHRGYADNAGDIALKAMQEVMAYFGKMIEDRRQTPRDDLVSDALTWEIDGEKIPEGDLLALCLLLFMAGLDTVAQQLSYTFMHLANHDEDRRRIAEDPSLIPLMMEESLRYYSFVTPSRKVMADIEVLGCPVNKGQMVHLPLVSANRDSREFENADQFVLDRADNRHIAFGAGPHRCLGSHLARREMRIAFEAWHARIPEYRITEGIPIREHGGQVGLDNLPLEWDVTT